MTIHIYVKYATEKFGSDGISVVNAKPVSEVLKEIKPKAKKDTEYVKRTYVELFEEGIKQEYGNQFVQGNARDFGVGVNFKTEVKIHRENERNRSEKYSPNQQFVKVMIGGVNTVAFSSQQEYNSAGEKSKARSWYVAYSYLHDNKNPCAIFMPDDNQVIKYKGEGGQKTSLGYKEAAVHETGHILGLDDAYYYNEYKTDRCIENEETCSINGKEYLNVMKYGGTHILPNDFEMMLLAYKNKLEKPQSLSSYSESYKSYYDPDTKFDRKKSEAIINITDMIEGVEQNEKNTN